MDRLPAVFMPGAESDAHPVVSFLENHGIGFLDRSGYSPEKVSQETRIPENEVDSQYPILKWTDGTVLKNCDTDKLVNFLHERDYEFEDS